MKRTTAISFALFVMLWPMTPPVAEAATVGEVTTVEVIEVPVYVSRHGDSVGGLTRDRFELFVNGKPQPIEFFDSVDFGAASAEDAANSRQRRLVLLLLHLDSERFALSRARAAIDSYLNGDSGNDLIAVATIGGTTGLRMLVPFTRDRNAIRWSIRTLRPAIPNPLPLAAPREIPPYVPPPDEFFNAIADEPPIGHAHAAMEQTIEWLDDLARALAPLDGHKQVVLLSTGLDATPVIGTSPARVWSDLRQGPLKSAADLQQKRSIGAPTVSTSLVTDLNQLGARYANASIVFDAIDIAGIRLASNDPGQAGLYLLARTGNVIANRNNLTEAMQRATSTRRIVYVLGFHARGKMKKENRIEVRLRNAPRGVDLTYRQQFSRP